MRKIEQIGFFRLEHRYDRFQLDQPPKSRGNEASVEGTIVTDQPTQIITVVARNGAKTVEDCMGPPKGLYELEELIIDVDHYRRHPDCATLWCVVYDPDHLLLNADGLKRDLEGPRLTRDGTVDVRLLVL